MMIGLFTVVLNTPTKITIVMTPIVMGVTAVTDLQALHLEWVSRRFHLGLEMNRGV